ncbi:exported hypothetical protein [Candidatus Terasakiella magnetica]|nr:exported hypothetical protein [Candidatus Terasakiella magnetica]
MNTSVRLLALALLGLTATAGPVEACGGTGRKLLAMDGAPGFFLAEILPAGTKGYFKMEVKAPGDHWEIAAKGENEQVAWSADSSADGQTLWLFGKAAGKAEIPLRYVLADGRSRPARVFVRIGEAPPPPPVPSITIDKEEVSARVASHHGFLIRLTVPLAPDHSWEVKEAVFADWGEEKWQPFERLPQQESAGVFGMAVLGKKARIVFVQKGDAGELSSNTVTLLLDVEPIPLC